VVITAFLSSRSGGKLSIIALKQFCLAHLPAYMVPDRFSLLPSLPRTSTDKVDYQGLKQLVG
jgi:acyl-CoA synthetase (AMP-forming)/AMP-acid ligase II